MTLKIAHFAAFSPVFSGQFATVIDLIKAERLQGCDAQFIDFGKGGKPQGKEGLTYQGIETISPSWAVQADVIVRHTVIPKEIESLKRPTIMALHGRPENSFMLEYLDRIPVYSLIQQASQLGHYKAFITFWKEFVPNWSLLVDRGKIFHVPAMVDLERFSPNGPKFSFGSKGGNPNILIFDNWREDTTPYNVIHAAIRFIKNRVSAGKIHLFGLHSDKKILDKYMGFLAEQGFIGHAWSFVDFVQEILRSADMLVTPHVIATRVIRESLACGCPVVAGGGCPYTPYRADPRNEADFARAMEKCWFDVLCKKDDLREQSRKTAEEQFSLKAAGEKMIQICEFAMQEKRTGIRLHA